MGQNSEYSLEKLGKLLHIQNHHERDLQESKQKVVSHIAMLAVLDSGQFDRLKEIIGQAQESSYPYRDPQNIQSDSYDPKIELAIQSALTNGDYLSRSQVTNLADILGLSLPIDGLLRHITSDKIVEIRDTNDDDPTQMFNKKYILELLTNIYSVSAHLNPELMGSLNTPR